MVLSLHLVCKFQDAHFGDCRITRPQLAIVAAFVVFREGANTGRTKMAAHTDDALRLVGRNLKHTCLKVRVRLLVLKQVLKVRRCEKIGISTQNGRIVTTDRLAGLKQEQASLKTK